MPTNYRAAPEFEKDLKRLRKRYITLPEDLEEFKKVLEIKPLGAGKNFAVLARKRNIAVVKARLFCRSLKRNSLRIIYAYIEKSAVIEFIGIKFIELYFKGDREVEDRERIKRYLDCR